MKLLIQRVTHASVSVHSEVVASIHQGFLCFLGISNEDTSLDSTWIIKKLLGIRLFPDSEGKLNLNLQEVGGECLVVSQFTLMADCRKGTRPSFGPAMNPVDAQKMYDDFLKELSANATVSVQAGIFGADMKVELLNDGPVTILLDSKNR